MPVAITCPRCRHHFILDSDPPPEVQCPQCKSRLKVQAPSTGTDPAKGTPDDPAACLRQHYPDLSDEDAQLAIDMLGDDRCRLDRTGLGPLKQVPRPSKGLDLAKLQIERRRALDKTPQRRSRFLATKQQYYAMWITVTVAGAAIVGVGAVYVNGQWLRLVVIGLGLATALLGASTLYRHFRGQQDISETPIQRYTPQGTVRTFYDRGVLGGRFDLAHPLLSPSLREHTTPDKMKQTWSRWTSLAHQLLSLRQFQAHIYEQLGPGFDVEGPHIEASAETDAQPVDEGIARGALSITFHGRYTVHEQEAYRSWNREFPDSGQITCVYRAPIAMLLVGEDWLVTDRGPDNYRLVEFYGEGALEAVRFEPGAVAEGQLDLDVVEKLILGASQKLKKRGWF